MCPWRPQSAFLTFPLRRHGVSAGGWASGESEGLEGGGGGGGGGGAAGVGGGGGGGGSGLLLWVDLHFRILIILVLQVLAVPLLDVY